jgi:ribosomal protein S18 acetylase RimI-like enzyme
MAMSTVLIRKLKAEDAPVYRAVRLESLRSEPGRYGSTYEEESQKAKLAFESHLEQQSPYHHLFGAFIDGELIGITAYFRDSRTRLRHRGKVTQVYVDARYRGQGIAKTILKAVIEDAFANPEIDSLELEVVDSNAPAIAVYETLGFKTLVTFENYFKDNGKYIAQRFMLLSKS